MKKQLSLIEQIEYNTQEYVNELQGSSSKTKTFNIKIKEPQTNNREAVYDLRKTLELTQAQLSMILSVSQRTVESWEQGRTIPNGSSQRLMDILKKYPTILSDIITVE